MFTDALSIFKYVRRFRTKREKFFSAKTKIQKLYESPELLSCPFPEGKWFVLLIFWEESSLSCYTSWQIVLLPFTEPVDKARNAVRQLSV